MPHPNLTLAQQAVAYVKGYGLMASNRQADRLAWAGGGTLDAHVTGTLSAFFQADDVDTYIDDEKASIKKWAQIARVRRTGNCEVQARLAFDWLASLHGHPRLELMSLRNDAVPAGQINAAITGAPEEFEGPDHVLVVLGRSAGNPGNALSWNQDAVLCDPWAKRAYHAFAIADEMALIRRVTGGATQFSQMFELAAGAAW